MDERRSRRARIAGFFGLASALLLVVGAVLPAFAYRGGRGEPYSFLNHFISELGQVGVSRLAAVFNLCLVLGGAALLPFALLLGLAMRRGVATWLAVATGLGAATFMSLIGFFPMNELQPHVFVALWFFRLGLAMVLLFTVAIFAQEREDRILPLWINGFGALSALCFAAFLFVVPGIAEVPGGMLDPSGWGDRPVLVPLSLSEWSIYVSTLAWVAGVSARLVLGPRRRTATRGGA